MKKNITKLLCIITALLLLAAMTGCANQGVATDSVGQAVPELRVDSNYIQWRNSSDAQWQNLIALSEIKGETGSEGEAGLDGSDGAAGSKGETGNTGAKGPTGARGETGATGTAGADGREIEIQNSGTDIQWRYEGETTWNNLVSISDITGPQGEDGAQGIQGVQGIQGPAGEDGTVSAYAQYAITGISTTTGRLAFGSDIASTGSSLISNPGTEYISLASGHCYLITYSIFMLNTDSAFITTLNPSLTDLSQTTDSFQYDPHGQVALLSGSFIADGGGLLWFDMNTDHFTQILGEYSIVTVLCLN